MKKIKKLLAYIHKFRTGKCGTLLYEDGCNCIDCQKLYELEKSLFDLKIKKYFKRIKNESNL